MHYTNILPYKAIKQNSNLGMFSAAPLQHRSATTKTKTLQSSVSICLLVPNIEASINEKNRYEQTPSKDGMRFYTLASQEKG
jgi:hypothetical protein